MNTEKVAKLTSDHYWMLWDVFCANKVFHLHNLNPTIKIRTLTLLHCYGILRPHSSIPVMFYMAKGSYSESGIAFSCHVSIVSSLKVFLIFSLIIQPDTLEEQVIYFVEYFLI